MRNRLSTGVDALDEHLDGGPRPGTLISLVAPPESQAGTLFYALMRERSTLYITTLRPENAVRDELEHVLDDTADYAIRNAGHKTPIRNVNKAIQQAGASQSAHTEMNIVIDTMAPLERTGKYGLYVDLLNGIKSHLLEVGGLAVFYCTKRGTTRALREVTLTISDLVMNLEITTDKSTVENQLTVPKYRGRAVVDQVIKLKLGREAVVDTSRNL